MDNNEQSSLSDNTELSVAATIDQAAPAEPAPADVAGAAIAPSAKPFTSDLSARTPASTSSRRAVAGRGATSRAAELSLAECENGVAPQACSCGTSELVDTSYVYSIGKVKALFPNLSLEQEFWQAVDREQATGSPFEQLLYDVLSQGENLYIAREICWVYEIDRVEAYIVQPRSPVELTELISAIRPTLGQERLDLLVGVRGPLAPPSMCNGIQLPIVAAAQFFGFTKLEFGKQISAATAIAEDVPLRLLEMLLQQVTDNAGESDEHRAINYVMLRYRQVYKLYETMTKEKNSVLKRIRAEPRPMGGRAIVSVIFTYMNVDTQIETHWYVRVDVTGLFPFLVSPLEEYFPHP